MKTLILTILLSSSAACAPGFAGRFAQALAANTQQGAWAAPSSSSNGMPAPFTSGRHNVSDFGAGRGWTCFSDRDCIGGMRCVSVNYGAASCQP